MDETLSLVRLVLASAPGRELLFAQDCLERHLKKLHRDAEQYRKMLRRRETDKNLGLFAYRRQLQLQAA
jgi:hypothetical protein